MANNKAKFFYFLHISCSTAHDTFVFYTFLKLLLEIFIFCFYIPADSSSHHSHYLSRLSCDDIIIRAENLSPSFFKDHDPKFLVFTLTEDRSCIFIAWEIIINPNNLPYATNANENSVNSKFVGFLGDI